MSARPFHLRALEPTEAQIQSSILRALKAHPAVGDAWRNNTGAFAIGEGKNKRFVSFGKKGNPDIIGYLTNGRFLGIEVKRPSGKLSPEQKEFIDKAKKGGAVVFVARSVSDVWETLDSYKETV